MPEQKMTESGQAQPGTPEKPNSESSQGDGDKPTSQQDEQVLQQLNGLVEKALAKALANPAFLQSVKDKTLSDKRVLQNQKTLKDIQFVLGRFKGVVPDDQLAQIQHDIEFDELKRKVYGDEESTSDSTAGKPESAATDFSKDIDKALNLPENDSRVTQLKIDHGNDNVAYVQAAVQLAAQLAGKPESTPGEQPVMQGHTPPKPEVNPIENITDSRTLYRMAAEQMAKAPRRRTR